MNRALLRWIDGPNCAQVNAWAEPCRVEYLYKLCQGEYMDRNVTSRSGVLPEKPVVVQQVKKFPTLYDTWGFITAFTRTRHVSLFLFKLIHSTAFFDISFNTVLPSAPIFQIISFGFPHQSSVCIFHSPAYVPRGLPVSSSLIWRHK